MKNKLFAYAMIPALGLGFLGANVASAYWMGSNATPQETATRQSEMFQETATLLGISVEAVKDAWSNGKSVSTLATENGITDEVLRTKMEAARKAKIAAHLQVLVTQGVITQAQADKRLATMETMKGKHKGGRGAHRGMGDHDMGGF